MSAVETCRKIYLKFINHGLDSESLAVNKIKITGSLQLHSGRMHTQCQTIHSNYCYTKRTKTESVMRHEKETERESKPHTRMVLTEVNERVKRGREQITKKLGSHRYEGREERIR